MKQNLIRRFSTVEVVLHAVQLFIYLILFISGLILLFQRIFETEKIDLSLLSDMHRLGGLVLVGVITQTVIISIFSENFRSLWKTLFQSFKWSFNDFIWLIKMPFHVFNTKISLPPSDRLNPGQKLHLLTIFFLLIIFSVTGLLIILRPGLIGLWVIHSICFVPALLFLLLHMFLSLINPHTRKALKGMVTGFVPVKYANEHHPLWQKIEKSGGHVKHISLIAIVVTSLIFSGLISAVVWHLGFNKIKLQVKKVVNNKGRQVILPGMLASVHAEEPEARECSACHNYFNSPESEKCLKCHKEIRTIIDNKQGYHGTFNRDCHVCHHEHKGVDANIIPLKEKKFNHSRARYTLYGKHINLDCKKCHYKRDIKNNKKIRMKYISLKFENCVDCHQNPHSEIDNNSNCLTCHTMQGWLQKELIFNHNMDSKYTIQGKHLTLSCEKCHVKSEQKGVLTKFKLKNIGNKCKDCHEDNHNNQFKNDCESCHSDMGWSKPLLIDFHGPNSQYPLKGKHNKVKCSDCHKLPNENSRPGEAKFASLPQKCLSCHNDPHKDKLSHSCDICHREEGWKGKNLLFEHNNNSDFKLDNVHINITCSGCHHTNQNNVTKYKSIPKTCDGCHNDMVNYTNGQLLNRERKADPHAKRVTCIECHSADEASQQPYKYAQKCKSCHNPHYFDLYFDWQKALARNLEASLQLLKNSKENNKTESSEIEKEITLMRKIGFHNITLADELFHELMGKHNKE